MAYSTFPSLIWINTVCTVLGGCRVVWFVLPVAVHRQMAVTHHLTTKCVLSRFVIKQICVPVPFGWHCSSTVAWPQGTRNNLVDCVRNVMAHAQKPDIVFWRNEPVHLNRRGHQFSRLLAAEVCVSAIVTLDTPCSEVVWRVLATHSIYQFPLHFPSRASPRAITFQLNST